jgi:hypothetical protein
MSDYQLYKLMAAYDLGSGGNRYIRHPYSNALRSTPWLSSSTSERFESILTLLDFLGADRLVEYLQYRRGQ